MNFIDKLLLISIIILPGFYLGDNYISFTDFVIPLVFIMCLIENKKLFKLKGENRILGIYILICGISIFFAMIRLSDLCLNGWMKFLRLFYLLLVIHITNVMNRKSKNKENNVYELLNVIMKYGIVSGIITIYLFVTQSMLFKPTQQMVFAGRVIYRASGVFGDCQTAGLMMALVFMISFVTLFLTKRRKDIVVPLISMIISFAVIVLSDTRAALFGVFIGVITYFVKTGLLKARTLLLALVGIVLLCVVYINNSYVNRVVNERILPLIIAVFSGDKSSVALLSANRFDIWNSSLKEFWEFDIISMLFGTGYKVEATTTDNNFVFALINTGIVGLIIFITYWISVFKNHAIKKTAFSIYKIPVLAMLLLSLLTCDMITLYRPMYLLVLFFSVMGCQEKKMNKNLMRISLKNVVEEN